MSLATLQGHLNPVFSLGLERESSVDNPKLVYQKVLQGTLTEEGVSNWSVKAIEGKIPTQNKKCVFFFSLFGNIAILYHLSTKCCTTFFLSFAPGAIVPLVKFSLQEE